MRLLNSIVFYVLKIYLWGSLLLKKDPVFIIRKRIYLL